MSTKTKSIITLVARVLLGLVYFVFGINFFIPFIPSPPPMEGAAGAYMGGLTKRESLAVGFGLNARGAMEIILGTLALAAGLIDEKMFVALVVMALLTSMISGPLMKKFID